MVNFHFLTEKEKAILYSYPFIANFLDGSLHANVFLKNLELFKNQLLEQGLNENLINFLRFSADKGIYLDSIANWRKYWKSDGYTFGASVPWHKEKEIRLFKMPEINEKVAKLVLEEYSSLIGELGLDIKILYFGSHPSMIDQVRSFIRNDGKLNSQELHMSLYDEPWRKLSLGGRQHGDIVIVSQYLAGYEGWWGGTQFTFGSSIISVPIDRQNNFAFIGNVAKHEATHMLGYGPHHDDNSAKVKGYLPVRDCLTFHRCSSRDICTKCKDAIVNYWEGIEERTKRKYFR